MTPESLVTSAMLSKLKKSLSEKFSLFQQKKETSKKITAKKIDKKKIEEPILKLDVESEQNNQEPLILSKIHPQG